MNYIRHLAGFFDKVSKDDRLGPLHVSMYVSLFQFWNASRFKNPISISRSEVMRISKICSKATYHKCIKELNEFGYLKYKPSFNPIRGSLIYLFNFETSGEPVQERLHTKIETASGQVEEPYINITNRVNNKTAYEQSENTSSNNGGVNEAEKATGKNSRTKRLRQTVFVPPDLAEVRHFFEGEKSTKLEAEKFFNYFQSNGWKVGGRAPMKDWQAAARNWMLNAETFKSKQKTSSLHATTGKNYGEPL
ncbi:MAG: transcriptional regulator [Bacteroidetes bacterium CHB5]|nr:transcriptional regulator [Bacteroidetes bacterium CHB5]